MVKVILISVLLCFESWMVGSAQMPYPKPRVCIIGAGISGLVSAKYLRDEGINFTVFEGTRYVGGTWRYDPRVGTDENGLPLHTSMYKHLRTNLPIPTMELRGFPVPSNMPSFPSWQMYYDYVQKYAEHFNLKKHIKFLHYVTSVRREDNLWKVTLKDVSSGEELLEVFDYVIVATGHYNKPNYPDIRGQNKFKGTIIHSHDYREPNVFTGRRVLVVGAGPSGMDIGIDVAVVSKTLFHSHHSIVKFRTRYPSNYIIKPDIKEFKENGVVFVDGSYEDIDDVIYCTGYQYYFPFLDETSELTMMGPRAVMPLYRYIVNVNQPTMLFLGLVFRACIVIAIDAQARYAASLIKGNFTLPSKEEMRNEWQNRVDAILSKGLPLHNVHLLADKEDEYYEALSKESGIERVPPVMFKIRTLDTEAKIEDLYTYRNYKYKIIDSNTFIRTLETLQ